MTPKEGIYLPQTDDSFQKLIFEVLKRTGITDKKIMMFLDESNIKYFQTAFTSTTAELDVNYEKFEQLGDVSANKFLVYYMWDRFPNLDNENGVKIVARLRINYGAKQSFFKIAEDLGFWPYIRASNEERSRNKKSLLEDCFEAFIGVVEYLGNKIFKRGIGSILTYNILESIFNDIHISLKYEDLYDSKTRLKELFDYEKTKLGQIKYTSTRNPDTGIFEASAIDKKGSNEVILGTGSAAKKADAEQKAAEKALVFLKKQNIYKEIPIGYE
jgi:dsRNA-specific ribonuclease